MEHPTGLIEDFLKSFKGGDLGKIKNKFDKKLVRSYFESTKMLNFIRFNFLMGITIINTKINNYDYIFS